MPIPLVADQDRRRIAEALQEAANLVLRIRSDPGAPPPSVNLGAIAERLERVDRLLEEGIAAGGIKRAQIRSIGAQLEAVGRELRKTQRRATAARTRAATSRSSRSSRTPRATGGSRPRTSRTATRRRGSRG